ncbi:Serine/threonine-protein kinase SZE1 [Cardamine amara subsp. amara]|uniref:Serine/threonine-protein kinase SZE1 n=1 Tax=Cardamine amara subsp. amara TaxID=228776 RepID=A0ABD1C487_CARAN
MGNCFSPLAPSESRPKSLPWATWLKISIEAAQCLASTAHFSPLQKSYSIWSSTQEFPILDSKRYLLMMKDHTSPRMQMNHKDIDHYAPPEYIISGNNLLVPHKLQITILNSKTLNLNLISLLYPYAGMSNMAGDVYSFGVILLEIITGFGKKRIILAKRAIRNEKENIAEMIDPELENSYPHDEGMLMCEIIKQCLEENPQKRPSMQQVFDNLIIRVIK